MTGVTGIRGILETAVFKLGESGSLILANQQDSNV